MIQISGWNKALETPFWALRADQTYLFTSETKRSSKSIRPTVKNSSFLQNGTAYVYYILLAGIKLLLQPSEVSGFAQEIGDGTGRDGAPIRTDWEVVPYIRRGE